MNTVELRLGNLIIAKTDEYSGIALVTGITKYEVNVVFEPKDTALFFKIQIFL